jgi:signal transduction histidine kinase/ligand-binding sensor domain-containing protein
MRRALLAALFVVAAGAGPAHAIRLPLRSYGPAEGLTDAGVYRVRIGPEGFVWIATRGGLWRFDGERFDVLGPDDGIPRGEVFDFAFTPDGSLWIASEAGLFHGDPARIEPGHPTFSETRLADATRRESPHRLAPAADGSVWVGTFHGLWHVSPGALPRRFDLGGGTSPPNTSRVQALAVDPSGAVWAGMAGTGVYRVNGSGRIDHCGDQDEGCRFVRDFLFDGEGGVWAAYFGGVARFDIATFRAGAVPTVDLRPKDGLPGIDTGALLSMAPDHLLLASTAGITEIDRDASGRWKVGTTLDRRSGLRGDNVLSLARDAAGNLWIGFMSGGLTKRIAGGFVEQDDAEEPGTRIVALGRGRDGRLIVLSTAGAVRWTVRIVSADRTETYHLPLPKGFDSYVGWGRQQLLAQERNGAWWVAGGAGPMRFDPSREGRSPFERPPDRIIGTKNGLASTDVYVLFIDTAGDLWVSSSPAGHGVGSVAHVTQAMGTATTFSTAAIGSEQLAVGFAEDRERQLWIAFADGTLVRRRGGRFERIARPFEQLDAAPLLVDARGRLWILGNGLAVVDRPGDEHAEARPFALPRALEGASFLTAVDDGAGTLYLGTSRGVVRLEPDTGRSRLLTAADGLVSGIVYFAARDGDGVLWFSDESGLSRYRPGPERPVERHAPRIREVRVAGIPSPVPATGAPSIGPLTIEPSRRTIEIGYFAVHQGPGEPPRFQHRLFGTDADWSAATSARSVLYAGLAPGRYRFGVRAVEAGDGTASEPATVEFRVLAPIWLRGWFVVLAAVAAASLVYSAHRLRVARIVAIERVRTRIATDLHDEIGSSLSQISVLSQVAERDAVRASGSAPRSLSRIAELARGVTESVGETVWAISPREDRVSDLVHRMRRFALDLFADGDVEIALDLPSDDSDERLDPEIRRTFYLVFKEALHNARKHAAMRRVDVALRRDRGGLELRVVDDGKGFDPSAPSKGHGLDGMRRRAEAIGGRFEVRAAPDGGTTIVFHAPLGARSLFRRIVGRRGGAA